MLGRSFFLKKILSGLFLVFLVAGCSKEALQEISNQSSKEYSPPTVQFKIDDAVYSTKQGSFCWRNDNSAECLSLPSPTEIVEETKPIKVKGKETITLLMERQPSEHTLTIENSDFYAQELAINEDNQFKTPEIDGVYILKYYAIWEKDISGTSGDSSYVFKIEVK